MTSSDPVLAFNPGHRTNAQLIADAHTLGYVRSPVFDATYHKGGFWTIHRPHWLITNDLYYPGSQHQFDYRLPFPEWLWGRFATVVFDPPYKLAGRVSPGEGYGLEVGEVVPIADRLRDMQKGIVHCADLVAPDGHLLIKCQDQVASGRVYWQTDLITNAMRTIRPGWRKVDALHLPHLPPRPQRSQTHARRNFSTLLVFRRPRR